MTDIRTALVVGGGIAGPVAAMAMRKIGIGATVYEAHPRSADGIGAFLTIASNGIGALRTIGADRRVLDAGFQTPTILLRSTTGKDLGVVPLGVALSDGTTSHTLERSDLYRAVQDEAASRGIVTEHGKRLVGIDEGSDQVTAFFEDGSRYKGDVLIGADGINSVVRRLIDPDAPAPTYSGLIGLGGYAHDVEIDAEPGSYIMMFGKRAFFGYVLAPMGEIWWFANVPARNEPARDELEAISLEGWQRTLVELFAEDAGPARSLVQATDTTGILPPSPIYSVPYLPAWHSDRMVVIGDAAHAPTPTSGQGASLAIEDAVVLAKCLRDVVDPHQAFETFESLRRRRVERIIKAAARTNNNKTAGGLARVMRDAILPTILKLMTHSKKAKEPYDYDIDWNTPAAMEHSQSVSHH